MRDARADSDEDDIPRSHGVRAAYLQAEHPRDCLLYTSFAGSIEALGVISDTDFITAMVLLLLALFFARLGDHAAEREAQRRKYIDRRHARPEEPEYRQNRRDA